MLLEVADLESTSLLVNSFLGLLLLVVEDCSCACMDLYSFDWSFYIIVYTHAAGVSLTFLGATISNDSFVDFDYTLHIGSGSANIPSNRNTRDAALQCITDLEDCCDTESGVSRTERGNWYLPHCYLFTR